MEFDMGQHDNDHWPVIEIDQLRDDVESAEMGEAMARQEQSRAEDRAIHWKNKHRKILKTMHDKIQESNGELSKKSMVYLSLINEYEMILGSIMDKYRVKLSTTRVDNLRKRGGLSV